MIDVLDGRIIHALRCAPRASYNLIGEAVGVSEQTVARRYRRLRADGVVRVLGLVEPAARGQAQWSARIRCRPDHVTTLAESLSRRSEVAYVSISSGGSQLLCTIQSPLNSPHDEILLQRLPRASSVLDVSIDLVLHRFVTSRAEDWGMSPGALTAAEVTQLSDQYRAEHPDIEPDAQPLEPGASDETLLAALAGDGRASYAELAAMTAFSPARVAARMATLEQAGTLYYDVDVLPEQLGYGFQGNVWLRVAPDHLHTAGTALAAHDEVAFAGAMTGTHNVLAAVICRDAEAFYGYLSTRVAELPGVASFEVSITTRRVKQAGSIIAGGRLIHPPRPR